MPPSDSSGSLRAIGPVLYTKSLILRPPTHADVPFLLATGLSPLNNRYLPHFIANPSTLEKTTAWVNRMLDESRSVPRASAYLVIEEKETGEVLGDSGLGRIFNDAEHALSGGDEKLRAEIGVLIDSKKTRRGYAVEALYASIEWAFEGEDAPQSIESVELNTLDDNAPMRGVFEKAFGVAGKLRERTDGLKDRQYEIRREAWKDGVRDGVKCWLDDKAKGIYSS